MLAAAPGRYPTAYKLIKAAPVQTIRAGYILSIRFIKYSCVNTLFSNERLIKKPLTKKKIGTPGTRLRRYEMR
jgi:hypothetical protein